MKKMQDVKFIKPLGDRRPKNRIEEALQKASANTSDDFLPSIDKRTRRPEDDISFSPIAESEPVVAEVVKKEKSRFKRLIALILLFLVALSYAGYKNHGYISRFWMSGSGTAYEDIVAEVGKLVALPAGEDPTVATVTNLEPLAGQEFFKDAMVGDKVLIFSKSKKAVLYRPSEKRVVVMAPLNN